ncbi:MAG: DNA/RNA nuclease SfsA [Clostridia bacterium]|nr:DNA/RNA nuclease SfsA [Clostridia bacterium]
MEYRNMREGIFISRPNRFIANIEIDGSVEVCHVKNTGRCRELLIPGTRVWVEESGNPARKTKYDLVTVDRGGVIVNMDSQAPNKLFAEWAKENIKDLEEIKSEVRYGSSRFDFRLRAGGKECYVEVKGCTLEREGVALFPDAPTDRGVKHLRELIEVKKAGLDAMVFFVIQMKAPKVFRPNRETHPEFAEALRDASEAGVKVLAYDCGVVPGRVMIDSPVKVEL